MKASEEKFFNKICLEMYEEIRRFVKCYVHDDRIIDDITQETFIEAYKHVDELMKHPNYKGWLYNTAKFKAKYLRASQYKRDSMQTEIDNLDREENAIYDTHEQLLYDELKSRLSPKDYRLIILKYKMGYTYEEIARKDGSSPGACKMRINRIIKKLRGMK